MTSFSTWLNHPVLDHSICMLECVYGVIAWQWSHLLLLLFRFFRQCLPSRCLEMAHTYITVSKSQKVCENLFQNILFLCKSSTLKYDLFEITLICFWYFMILRCLLKTKATLRITGFVNLADCLVFPREKNVSESGSVSALRWKDGQALTHFGPLERANVNHWT
jgi:hypothetical protein